MKKKLFFLVLCTILSFNAIAGYVIRGFYTNDIPDLKNYTLTTDASGIPISASSMNTFGGGTAKNSIVIVRSDVNGATVFNISLPSDPYPLDVEVKDFHYESDGNRYVLCGSRETGLNTTAAFVAVINSNFTSMQFVQYSEAEVFYSVVANFPPIISTPLGYYLCGKIGDSGVLCSINRTTLQFTNFYETDFPWEYNKIVVKQITSNSVLLISSGRVPGYTRIGFTTFDTSFTNRNSYMWAQNTDPNSLCVVTDYPATNMLVLASSYQKILSLRPINRRIYRRIFSKCR
jgi:hypothetical protein